MSDPSKEMPTGAQRAAVLLVARHSITVTIVEEESAPIPGENFGLSPPEILSLSARLRRLEVRCVRLEGHAAAFPLLRTVLEPQCLVECDDPAPRMEVDPALLWYRLQLLDALSAAAQRLSAVTGAGIVVPEAVESCGVLSEWRDFIQTHVPTNRRFVAGAVFQDYEYLLRKLVSLEGEIERRLAAGPRLAAGWPDVEARYPSRRRQPEPNLVSAFRQRAEPVVFAGLGDAAPRSIRDSGIFVGVTLLAAIASAILLLIGLPARVFHDPTPVIAATASATKSPFAPNNSLEIVELHVRTDVRPHRLIGIVKNNSRTRISGAELDFCMKANNSDIGRRLAHTIGYATVVTGAIGPNGISDFSAPVMEQADDVLLVGSRVVNGSGDR